jgi:hypothetical protein
VRSYALNRLHQLHQYLWLSPECEVMRILSHLLESHRAVRGDLEFYQELPHRRQPACLCAHSFESYTETPRHQSRYARS